MSTFHLKVDNHSFQHVFSEMSSGKGSTTKFCVEYDYSLVSQQVYEVGCESFLKTGALYDFNFLFVKCEDFLK